jgi:hypothetical protein
MAEIPQVTKKTYLPQHERIPGGIAFTLTDRDIDILSAVNRCRFMRTGQIWRLVFPGNTSMQSCRRRLKYLYHNEFLERVVPFVQIGKGSAETAYCLGKLGRAFLETEGEKIRTFSREHQVGRTFLHHALDITEFRVHLETALRDHPVVALHRFTADFELKSHIQQAVGKHRYKLYEEVVHPVNRRKYPVFPDALIILRGRDDFAKYQRLYFLEVDRGTMGLERIREKVIGYNLYKQLKIYQKFGWFSSFTVLFQTSSSKRATNVRTALTDQAGSELVWVTDVGKVRESTVLSEAIWVDSELNNRCVVKNTPTFDKSQSTAEYLDDSSDQSRIGMP